jgi:hypothetical protein
MDVIEEISQRESKERIARINNSIDLKEGIIKPINLKKIKHINEKITDELSKEDTSR